MWRVKCRYEGYLGAQIPGLVTYLSNPDRVKKEGKGGFLHLEIMLMRFDEN